MGEDDVSNAYIHVRYCEGAILIKIKRGRTRLKYRLGMNCTGSDTDIGYTEHAVHSRLVEAFIGFG